MKKQLTKSLLTKLVKDKYTHREIAEITGYSKSNVGYWVKKYELSHLNDNKPEIEYKDKDYFNKINTPSKAYILGFILADGYINKEVLEITVALKDKVILEFIKSELGGNIIIDENYNKKQRRFPRARLSYYNKTILNDLIKLSVGEYKEDRRVPRISPKLENYMLLGFFDGDGCITWGERKDRNRLWYKISFTSQLKMLEGIQGILYNQVGISSIVRPKSDGSNCYVLSFSNRQNIIDYLNYVYQDSEVIPLKRKYQNANNLRLELEEFGRS